jgi:hypothetical protein
LRLSKTWGGGQGAGTSATVEQFLIRGLVTACQVCVVGLPRSDSRRSALPLPKLVKSPRTGTDALAASDNSVLIIKRAAART